MQNDLDEAHSKLGLVVDINRRLKTKLKVYREILQKNGIDLQKELLPYEKILKPRLIKISARCSDISSEDESEREPNQLETGIGKISLVCDKKARKYRLRLKAQSKLGTISVMRKTNLVSQRIVSESILKKRTPATICRGTIEVNVEKIPGVVATTEIVEKAHETQSGVINESIGPTLTKREEVGIDASGGNLVISAKVGETEIRVPKASVENPNKGPLEHLSGFAVKNEVCTSTSEVNLVVEKSRSEIGAGGDVETIQGTEAVNLVGATLDVEVEREIIEKQEEASETISETSCGVALGTVEETVEKAAKGKESISTTPGRKDSSVVPATLAESFYVGEVVSQNKDMVTDLIGAIINEIVADEAAAPENIVEPTQSEHKVPENKKGLGQNEELTYLDIEPDEECRLELSYSIRQWPEDPNQNARFKRK